MQFESRFTINAPAFANEHCFHGTAVFPAAGYMEMALAAAQRVWGEGGHAVKDFLIREALTFSEEQTRTVQLILTPKTEDEMALRLFSLIGNEDDDNATWTPHVTAKIVREAAGTRTRVALDEIRKHCAEEISGAAFYQSRSELGAFIGSHFQALDRLWRREGEALGLLQLHETAQAEARIYHLHPALFDASMQLLLAALPRSHEIYLPISCDHLHFSCRTATRLWCHAKIHSSLAPDRETYAGDLALCDEAGDVIAEIKGLQLKRATTEVLQRLAQGTSAKDWLYEVVWRPQPLNKISKNGRDGKPEHWLILADRAGAGAELAKRLESAGTSCRLVFAGESEAAANNGRFTLNPERLEDFHALLRTPSSDLTGIVHLWSLDAATAANADALLAAQQLSCGSVMLLVQALNAVNLSPRLWLITQGAQAIEVGQAASRSPDTLITQTPLWGMARVIALEHPELRCARVDLDAEGGGQTTKGIATANGKQQTANSIEPLVHELLANDGEDQIAYREGRRYVARLVRLAREMKETKDKLALPSSQPFRLEKSPDGVLDHLKVTTIARREPAAHEVEIEVHGTGLNFRDVLNALGMYPGEAGPLGLECAGKIVAIGEEVKDFAIGEEVLAMAFGSFSSHVITNQHLVVHKPGHVSFEEAATIPVTFLTAYYGLHHLAKIKAGDRVLIHAAAGGVGLSAVQLAQAANAEIFATAGSAEKYALLKSFGVQHVFSSRTVDFADEILSITKSQIPNSRFPIEPGVDIVLNSLTGEFITKSVNVLAENGCFLEIGKRGIWKQQQFVAAKPHAAYHVIALDHMAQHDPAFVGQMFRELITRFEQKILKPLPLRSFAIADAVEAFRRMAQAKHIGKIVVAQKAKGGGHSAEGEESSTRSALCALPSATYLITGGLGGLGLIVAEWLVAKGARHLMLVGRREPAELAQAVIERMQQRGAQVVVAQGDVAVPKDVARILSEITNTLPPLRGIMHAAGVLSDGILLQQNWEKFETALKPKMLGAWHLHAMTKDLALDFFVCFSSVVALLGFKGQGNYATANAFLDGFAHWRAASGRNTISINWGPWAEAGMASSLGNRELRRWTSQGFSMIPLQQGLDILEQALAEPKPQIGVTPVNWAAYAKQFPVEATPRFVHELIRRMPAPIKTGEPTKVEINFEQRLQALAPEKRRDFILQHVREQAVKVLGLPPSKRAEITQPLKEMGLDSLMSVELRNALGASIGRTLPGSLVFDYPTIEAIAKFIANEVFKIETKSTKPAHEEAKEAAAVAEVQKLSEEEAEALLLEKMAALDERT